MTKRIIAITQPLVDILVTCDHAFLTYHNLKPGSWALVDTHTQDQLLAATQATATISSGGSGSNSLACASILGISGTCLCLAGSDLYGETFYREFNRSGVKTPISLVSGARTGTCLSLITPDGERTMRTSLGIGIECEGSHIQERDLAGHNWLLLEGGHFLTAGEKNRSALLKGIEVANKINIPVAFNVSSEFAASTKRDEIIGSILPRVALFVGNESEAIALSQQSNAHEAFTWLAARCSGVAVTCGSKGALLQYQGKQAEIPAHTNVQVVDSTGAGDAFIGVLLAGLTLGHSLEAAGRGAARLAAEVVSQRGGRLSPGALEIWKGAIGEAQH